MRRTGVRVSVFRNFIIQKIFSEFVQPLRDFRTQRVISFYLGFLLMLEIGSSMAKDKTNSCEADPNVYGNALICCVLGSVSLSECMDGWCNVVFLGVRV